MSHLLEHIEKHTDCEVVVSNKLFKSIDININMASMNYKRHNCGYKINLDGLLKPNTIITAGSGAGHSYYYARCHPVISFAIMPAKATAYIVKITPDNANLLYIIINDNYLIPANTKLTSLTNINVRLIRALTKLQASKTLDGFHDLIKNP